MDIIAAHRHGLIEKLDREVAALAGGSRDHGQRAVVLHHLYDHSRGRHVWALAEARQAMRIGAGIAALRHKLERWGWLSRDRDAARQALDLLAEALGDAAIERTAAALGAYRLSATAAVRSEVEGRMPAALLEALDECHKARRLGEQLPPETVRALYDESEQLAAAAVEPARLDLAWYAIEATGLGRAARRRLSPARLARRRSRDERRGWARVERDFLRDPALPASFRANPAQHFYALQQALAERRRKQWRDECDREPDAFELAA